MADQQEPQQWADRLTESIQHSLDFLARGIRDFAARRESEQRNLAAAQAGNELERARKLESVLASIDEEIAGLERGRTEYREALERIQTAVRGLGSDEASRSLNPAAVEETRHELKRLRRVYRELGLEFRLRQGVSTRAIRFVEAATGLRFDDHLRAMWRITDGSSDQYWFTDDGDDERGPNNLLNFLALSEALLKSWRPVREIVDPDEEEWRAAEIQPRYLRHHRWFPFGDYSGVTTVQFDGDPTPAGTYGQIIMYVHDPDAVYLLAPRFIDFFRDSNRVLEAALAADPDGLRARLAGD